MILKIEVVANFIHYLLIDLVHSLEGKALSIMTRSNIVPYERKRPPTESLTCTRHGLETTSPLGK